jgi:hypothetical protein
MVTTIYFLCALTSLLCAFLLCRGYLKTRYPLLFWSGLCFIGLTLNNLLVILDRIIFPGPGVDLLTWRLGATLISLTLMLVALIWQGD